MSSQRVPMHVVLFAVCRCAVPCPTQPTNEKCSLPNTPPDHDTPTGLRERGMQKPQNNPTVYCYCCTFTHTWWHTCGISHYLSHRRYSSRAFSARRTSSAPYCSRRRAPHPRTTITHHRGHSTSFHHRHPRPHHRRYTTTASIRSTSTSTSRKSST